MHPAGDLFPHPARRVGGAVSGYVKAHRDRFAHPLFGKEPFCRGYAWDWIVSRACWKATKYDVRGQIIEVSRGQFVASPDEMARAWNWSRSAVIRFLMRLQTEHMIEQSTGHKKTIITVCNYEKYQADEPNTGHKSGRNIGHKPDTNRTAKEEGEEGKKIEGSEEPKAPSAFDHLARAIGDDLASDFIAHRKALRKPMTANAGKLMAEKLASMPDPGAAIRTSIENGWAGVFPEKVTPIQGRGRNYGERFDDAFSDLTARLAVQPFPTGN